MNSKVKVKGLAAAGLLVAGGLAAALVVLVPGDGGGDGPRPVSAAEAQRMALARFRTYQASPSAVTVRAATPGGTTVIRAVVDHRTHRAVGSYQAGRARGLLAWDLSGVAVAGRERPPSAAGPGGTGGPVRDLLRAVRAVREREWTRREFSKDPLDNGLKLALSMAADRPDNAQLLAQSGPLWLKEERIDGRSYGVFSGPRPRPQGASASPSGRSPLTYWIDGAGSLRRLTADLGPDRTVTVDVTAGKVAGKVPRGPWGKGAAGKGAAEKR